jgi:holin-like protein
MRGFAILLGFNLLGLAVRQWGHVPLPANLIGLMLFTASLFAGWVKLEWVEQTAQFLTKHMLLFFIPFLVGTMTFFPQIGAQWLSVLIGLVVSTFAVLAVTGWVTSALSGRGEREDRSDPERRGEHDRPEGRNFHA